jgi:hypothetical protein
MRFATAQYRARAARVAADARERGELEDIAKQLDKLKIGFRRQGLTWRFDGLDDFLAAEEAIPALKKYRCLAWI